MSIGKLSSKKTPAHLRSKNDYLEDQESESNPKLVFTMIKSPSSSFKAEAPAQLLLKSALKDSKSKSGVKSANSGKSSKSVIKDSENKTTRAHILHFSPHHHTREDSFEDHGRSNQRSGRSGAVSVDKKHSRGVRETEDEYYVESRHSGRKSSYDDNRSKRSTPAKHGSTSVHVNERARRQDRDEYADEVSETEHYEDSHNKSHRYTIEEDLEILDYLHSKPNSNFTSKSFWQHAVDDDDLLGGRRSLDSIRERYRNHLRDLSEEEKRKLLNWHNQHGGRGYAKFSTVIIKDHHGRVHHLKKFEGVEPEADSHVPSSVSARKKKSNSKAATLTIDSKEGILKPAEEHFEEETVSHQPISNKKRKEYEAMHHLDESILPRKANRDEYYGDEYYDEYETRRIKKNKEIWLRELAERYMISPDQMTTLYYNCSFDSDLLQRYLDGEADLLWNNDEDILITGTHQEAAKRVLSRYKSVSNVNSRYVFLKKIDRLQVRP